MASLVDSRPSPTSVPLPQSQSQSPPIQTTTNTFPPAQQFPLHATDTPSPHLEIPGSFPHVTSRPSQRQNTSEASRGQASQLRSSFLIKERGFITQDDRHLVGARRTSLPSTEREGVKPGEHYDGVGPLPGSISETSVAKLPDERMQPAREADKPTQKHAAVAGTISLPSSLGERKGVQPFEHHDGVGPLPGTSSETSVAKLPDERAAALTSEGRPGAAAVGTVSQNPSDNTVTPTESRAPAPHAAQRILSPETGDQNVISQQPPPAQQGPERVDRGPDAVVSDSYCRVSDHMCSLRTQNRNFPRIRSPKRRMR